MEKGKASNRSVHRSACTEQPLVRTLFRIAESGGSIDRNCCAVVCDCCNHSTVLSPVSDCRWANDTLLAVGQFRLDFEFHDLEFKSRLNSRREVSKSVSAVALVSSHESKKSTTAV